MSFGDRNHDHRLQLTCAGLLEIAALHYSAAKAANWEKAEDFAEALQRTAAELAKHHRAQRGEAMSKQGKCPFIECTYDTPIKLEEN